MRVLYYLEPWLELDFPLFRLGTVRNHLRKEAAELIRSDCQVTLLTSAAVKQEVNRVGLLPSSVEIVGIDHQKLVDLAPNYFSASMMAMQEDPDNPFCEAYGRFIIETLGDYKPDVVIAYETAFSVLMRSIFHDSLVVDSTLGSFSREPYPETFCYDPFGSFAKSALSRFKIEELNPCISRADASEYLDPLRARYSNSLLEASPFSQSEIRKGFETLLLLPLQVSSYFAFDGCLPDGVQFTSQFQYLCWVLDNVPEDIGIVVTEHGFSPVVHERNLNWLKQKYKNFIYLPEHRDIRWSSQYLLSSVDGVITVSSSVGFQAAFYNKFLLVLGDSHLTPLADIRDISSLSQDRVHLAGDKSLYSHFLITRYNPLFDKHVLASGWFAERLRRMLELYRQGSMGPNVFEPVEAACDIGQVYLDSVRPCNVARSSPKRRSTDGDAGHRPAKVIEYNLPIKSICKSIDSAEVVSFDLFDTLLIREFDSPKALNIYISETVSKMLRGWGHSVSSDEFLQYRRKAASRLLGRAREGGVEDVNLRAIYNELRKNLRITKEQAVQLRKAEIDAESRSLIRRKAIFNVYRYALEKGKRIYFVSDMYLDEDFVTHLLKKHGFDEYEKLLLSSSIGKLKKTGNLFDELITISGSRAGKIFHIGDNEISDYDRAIERGIKAEHISKVSDTLCSEASKLFAFSRLPNNVWFGLQKGISARLLENNAKRINAGASLAGGSAYMLGAICGGPIVLGFAQWIYKQAIADGVEHIYFLARDGWYPKKIFDAISEVSGGTLSTSYMLASRRSVIGSALHREADVYKSLDASYSQCSIEFFLLHRFGLELGAHYSTNDLESVKVSPKERVDSKSDGSREKLKTVLSALMEKILENAALERSSYLDYLADIGFTSDKRIAIVDIGHNGTLQKGLGDLLQKKMLGYYFATFKKAQELLALGHEVKSYLLEFENSKRSDHFYCRNIGMFEFLFIPSTKSFIKMQKVKAGAGYEPVYMEIEEPRRVSVAKEVEIGIEEFCKSFISTLGMDLLRYEPEPEKVVSVYKELVENPRLEDVEIVKDVFFVDGFGGSESRYLVDPEIFKISDGHVSKEKEVQLVRDSWWRSGARVLINKSVRQKIDQKSNLGARERLWRPVFRPIVRHLANNRNMEFFESSPRVFFSGLTNKYYRRVGRIFFGGNQ